MCQILRKFTRRPRPDTSFPREGGRVRKRTAPLARERRNLRSESTVFRRRRFGRIPPFAGQSARDPRILERIGKSPGCRCRSYVNLQALRHPTLRILDSVGVSKNRRSRSYVNLRVFAIRCPISAGVWAVPKDDQASRSRGAQPSFRKCRILPSPFSPERAVPGPERPKWPNPR